MQFILGVVCGYPSHTVRIGRVESGSGRSGSWAGYV